MTNYNPRKVCAPPPRRAEFARLDFAIHWRICVFGLARCLHGFLSHPADDARVLSAMTQHQTNNHNRKKSMKLNRIFTVCAVAATLALGASSLLAQNNNNGGNNGGQNGRNRNGGGPGGGNFDPAAMQQRMVDGVRDRLGFTNDTEWAAVEPLVTKVVAARFDVGMGGGMRGMMGGRNRGGQGGGQANPEQEALQKAIDDNAPSSQIKDLLAKYKTVQKAKQAKLETAQAALKAVLAPGKQEAEAVLLGLVN